MKSFSAFFGFLLFSFPLLAQDHIILIGDSIFSKNGEIKLYLEENKGLDIVSYAQSGAKMDEVIDQYYAADLSLSNGVVLMNGGGNDILQDNYLNCRFFNRTCREVIDETLAKNEDLFMQMAEDGIQDVIFLSYYYTTGIAGGLDRAVDYAAIKLEEICEFSPYINCHMVDPRDEFRSGSNLIIWDGIHPTVKGSHLLAELIWETMLTNEIP